MWHTEAQIKPTGKIQNKEFGKNHKSILWESIGSMESTIESVNIWYYL